MWDEFTCGLHRKNKEVKKNDTQIEMCNIIGSKQTDKLHAAI